VTTFAVLSPGSAAILPASHLLRDGPFRRGSMPYGALTCAWKNRLPMPLETW
jgi:hypothetical protein